MDGVINLGPLALATDRLLAVSLLIGFLLAMDRILVRAGNNAVPATGLAIVSGLIAARVVYVVQHRDAFAYDWWSALAVWQGGFTAWAGLLAASAVLAWRMRPLAAMAKGLALLAVFGAMWFAGSAMLRPDARALPDLPQLVSLGGTPFIPEDLENQPFAVNLWATWCPPCRRELPMLADMAASSDMPILLVNQGDDPEVVRDYLFANRISPEAVVLDRQSEMMRALDGAALPTTLFVDASGQVVATHVGEISRAAMAARIKDLQGE
ncbi:TlpA disulfide reductase family protein [Roseibium sp.]|uniref:TlpA disulfide reductase family protein n=1 Tax=Roseibium sp. TaxID=1936156 RepID=UPI003298D307